MIDRPVLLDESPIHKHQRIAKRRSTPTSRGTVNERLTLPDPVTNTRFPFRSCKDDTVAGRQIDIMMMNNQRWNDDTLRNLMVVVIARKTPSMTQHIQNGLSLSLYLYLLTSRK